MNDFYWIIDYEMTLQSDFHVGSGVTLLVGNMHGLKLDEDGMPYLPHTQVRGLLRLGGYELKSWQQEYKDLFKRNFAGEHRNSGIFWSYTRAGFAFDPLRMWQGARKAGLLANQSHIKIDDSGVAENLFSFQKAGAVSKEHVWKGRIYSVEPAQEKDAAFMIASMRAEDRVGHRRSRGYGKVNWFPSIVRRYRAGEKPEMDKRSLSDWMELFLS